MKGLSHESIFVRIAPFSLTSITVIAYLYFTSVAKDF